MKFSYLSDDQQTYTDSLGNLIPAQGVELAQFDTGLNFQHRIPMENGSAMLDLTGGLSVIWSSTCGAGFAAQVVPQFEGGRARTNLGISYNKENGNSFSAEASYDGLGANDFESFGLQFQFGIDV